VIRRILAVLLLGAAACAGGTYYRALLALPRASGIAPPESIFTVTFTGTNPAVLILGSTWAAPKVAANALYDPGDGNWYAYGDPVATGRVLQVLGSVIRFKGDWRKSGDTYTSLFASTFTGTTYWASLSGAFDAYPAHASAYQAMFSACTRITNITDNPVPILSGAYAAGTYKEMFKNCTGLTGALPAGMIDTSQLSGGLAGAEFADEMFANCAGITSLPDNFLNTTGMVGMAGSGQFNAILYGATALTNLPANFLNTMNCTNVAPAAFSSSLNGVNKVASLPANFLNLQSAISLVTNSFYETCKGMSAVTHIPTNTLNLSGMSGTPVASSFTECFSGLVNVTNDYYLLLGAGISYTSNNVSTLDRMFSGCGKWTGRVMWGTNALVDAIPVPAADNNAFRNCTNSYNWATINANWK
jgi:hypothetical protein